MLIYSARSARHVHTFALACAHVSFAFLLFSLSLSLSLSFSPSLFHAIRFTPENLTAASDAAQCAFLARTEIGESVAVQKWFDERVGGTLIPRRTMY